MQPYFLYVMVAFGGQALSALTSMRWLCTPATEFGM